MVTITESDKAPPWVMGPHPITRGSLPTPYRESLPGVFKKEIL